MNLGDNRTSVVQAVDTGVLAGAVTLAWQRGNLLQVNEIGYRDVEAGLPMQRDTIFRVASMTKPVTVAAAMSLLEEGKLTLSDPVTRWLPELADLQVLVNPTGPLDQTVPARRPITIDDLMTHRSGLAYVFSVTGPISRAYGRVSFRQDQDHWLAEVAQLPLVHQPASGSPTATPPTSWASSCPGSKASPCRPCSPSGSSNHSGCPTPGSSSPRQTRPGGHDVSPRRGVRPAARRDGPDTGHRTPPLLPGRCESGDDRR